MVVLITNIPTPYRIPLFNEIHAQLARVGIGFKVVFAALTYARRKWAIDMAECRFQWEVLAAGRLPSRSPESAVFTYAGLGRVLRAHSGALCIVSGFSLATTRLWLRSFFRPTPYLIWSGAIERKNRPDSFLQRCQRRRVIARAHGFVAYGTRAKQYLVGLGAAPARVSIGINTVDVAYFRDEVTRLRSESSPNGLQRILYVGNLEKGKRIDHLLHAARLLAASRQDFQIELVGSGSQEQGLKGLACDFGLSERVRFLGFLQRPDVARRLAHACCFAFPSEYDIWGLVLVEAMAAGLCCLASVHAGATMDLIQDGTTGFSLDFEDVAAVAQRLDWVLSHPTESHKIGQEAARFIAEHASLSRSAAGFVDAVSRIRTGAQRCLAAQAA